MFASLIARLRSRRLWVGVLLVLVVLRAALPPGVRYLITSQASQFLHTQVDLADVDFRLWHGDVVLHDFAIHTPPNSDNAAPAPLVSWKRLAISLHWWPLVHHTIQLREIVLETPHVAVDRLKAGNFSFESLLAQSPPAGAVAAPSPTPEPSPGPKATTPSPWRIGIDRIALSGGGIAFQDFAVAGSEPVDLKIPNIEVHDIAFTPDVYGKASDSHISLALDQGSLELSNQLRIDGTNIDLDSTLRAHGLPVRRARLYVPSVGWSDLKGELDADVHLRFVSGTTNQVSGNVALRDLLVTVPSIPDAALAWKNFAVQVDTIDVLQRQARVKSVVLDGLWLELRADRPAELPFLDQPPAPPGALAPTPAPAAGEPIPEANGAAAGSGEPAKESPWQWSVDEVRVHDTTLRLSSDSSPIDVGVTAAIDHVSLAPEPPMHVDVTLALAEASVAVAGSTRLKPPGFDGTLKIYDLPVVELLTAIGQKNTPLQNLRFASDLKIAAGMGDGVAASDLQVSGTLAAQDMRLQAGVASISIDRLDHTIQNLTLAGVLSPSAAGNDGVLKHLGSLRLGRSQVSLANLGPLDIDVRENSLEGLDVSFDALPLRAGTTSAGNLQVKAKLSVTEPKATIGDGRDFNAGLAKLTLDVDDMTLPGLLQPAADRAAPRIVLSNIVVDRPQARLTRTKEGIVLPSAKSDAAEPPSAVVQPPPADAATGGAAAKAAAPDVQIRGLKISHAKLTLADRALASPVVTEMPDLNLTLRGLRTAPLTIEDLKLSVATMGSGKINASGSLSPKRAALDLTFNSVALTPYNPYASAYSPYRLSSGALSLATKVGGRGAAYDMTNHITLANLAIEGAGGESAFQQHFGIPLSMALALLRDASGKIELDVPVSIGEAGTTVDIGAVVASALKAAMVGALSSPLKLLGGFGGNGDQAALCDMRPPPLAFRTGRADLSPEAAAAATRLGEMLKARPALGLNIKVGVTQLDARWLHEQGLVRLWGEQGWLARLGGVFQRGTRERVRAALEERAAAGKGEMSAEDEAALQEWLADVPAPTAAQLADLGEQRSAQVTQALSPPALPEQIHLTQLPTSAETAPGLAAVTLRSVGDSAALPDSPAADPLP